MGTTTAVSARLVDLVMRKTGRSKEQVTGEIVQSETLSVGSAEHELSNVLTAMARYRRVLGCGPKEGADPDDRSHEITKARLALDEAMRRISESEIPSTEKFMDEIETAGRAKGLLPSESAAVEPEVHGDGLFSVAVRRTNKPRCPSDNPADTLGTVFIDTTPGQPGAEFYIATGA